MLKKICWFFIFLATLAGIGFWVQRIYIEQNHKKVELVLDYPSLVKLRDSLSMSKEEVWERLKAAGVTGVAFPENTLDDLQLTGQVRVSYPPSDILKQPAFVLELLDQVYPLKDFLTLSVGENQVAETNNFGKTYYRVASVDAPQYLRGMGFDPGKVDTLRNMGFDIYLRPESRETFTPRMMDKYFTALERLGRFKGVIFNGEEVLGYPGAMPELAKKLKDRELLAGSVEALNPVFRQKGMDELSEINPQGILRVSSFTPQYQNKLKPRELAGKFALGVKERDIRLIYFRPYFVSFEGREIWDVNQDFFAALRKDLEASGYRLASAQPYPPLVPPVVIVIMVVVGVTCGLILLLEEFFPQGFGWAPLLMLGMFLLFAGVYLKMGALLARQIFAFLAAVIFPVLALCVVSRSYLNLRVKTWLGIGLKSAGLVVKAALISFLGAIFLSALLSSTQGMIGIVQMRGIKLTLVLPFFILALWYLQNGFQGKVELKKYLDSPLKIWQVLLGILVLGAGAFLVFRSGNVGSEYVSGYEMNLRGILSGLLGVRPRFKEFVIGYPALFLLPFALQRGWKTFAGLLLFAGLIGLVSMVNSFAHIHTPLLITLQRMGNGLLAGIPAGILLTIILLTCSKK